MSIEMNRSSTQDKGLFMKDLSASLVVFLVALPLCMGIALASGMPAAAGLVTGIIGGLVVGFLAGSPLQVSVPIAVMMLWARFRPAKLKLVPGGLLGIATATAIAQAFHMTVHRVSVPTNLGDMITFPTFAGLQGQSWTGIIGTACAIAFIASA